MDPITIALIAGAVNMAVKGGTSIAQNNRAKQLEQMQRPEYNVPSAVNEAVDTARMAAANPQLYAQGLAQQNIGQNAAQAIRAAQQSGAGPNATIAAAGAINSGMNDASRNLAMAAEQQRNVDVARLMGMLGQQGSYQDRAFYNNQMDPYLDQQNAARDLRYAARGNVDSLMGDATNLGVNAAMGQMYSNFGQPQATPQSTQTGVPQATTQPAIDPMLMAFMAATRQPQRSNYL